MRILKYFTLILFCLSSYSLYSRTSTTKAQTTKKSTSEKVGENKSQSQLKSTCSKGKGKLRRSDFSSNKSYQAYVSLCKTTQASQAQTNSSKTKKSDTTAAYQVVSAKFVSSPSTPTSSPSSTAGSSTSSSSSKFSPRSQETTSLVLRNSRTGTLATSPMRRSTTTLTLANTTNPALANSPRQASIASDSNRIQTSSHISSNHSIVRQGQTVTGDNRVDGIHDTPIMNAQSTCPEQFNGPPGKFKTSCCQVMYNILEENYLQTLSQNVQTPVEEQDVKAAFLALNVMGETQARRLIGSISKNFEVLSKENLTIGQINKAEQTGQTQVTHKASSHTIAQVNQNLALLKYAIKVADTFIDSSGRIKTSLFAAFRGKHFNSANTHLGEIRRQANDNLEKALDIQKNKADLKKKQNGDGAAAQIAGNINSTAKMTFDNGVTKLQTLCPTFSFTIIGNYTAPQASAGHSAPDMHNSGNKRP
ncbi:MAG: hypothetical protein HYV97_05645 [Bdellovibrio sp.]|nr:hypothetical protein [Bdellovibrio sp.]